jgi:hypothetical protein
MAKRRAESQNKFDSQQLKVKNHLEIHVRRWCATCFWKVLDKDYNFVSNLTSIGGLHKKLWPSKMLIMPILGILGLPTWES